MSGISNGQLSAMEPDARREKIATLKPRVRLQLAHLALLGARRQMNIASELSPTSKRPMNAAREAERLLELAIDLTDGDL